MIVVVVMCVMFVVTNLQPATQPRDPVGQHAQLILQHSFLSFSFFCGRLGGSIGGLIIVCRRRTCVAQVREEDADLGDDDDDLGDDDDDLGDAWWDVHWNPTTKTVYHGMPITEYRKLIMDGSWRRDPCRANGELAPCRAVYFTTDKSYMHFSSLPLKLDCQMIASVLRLASSSKLHYRAAVTRLSAPTFGRNLHV
jgi:hypothetical protein